MKTKTSTHRIWGIAWGLALLAFPGCGSHGDEQDPSSVVSSRLLSTSSAQECAVIPRLSLNPTLVMSTLPPNGDVNPYGIAFVPEGFPRGGLLHEGDIVVSNFNNASNLQGTGTTIVRVNPNAAPTVFFQDGSAQGLSTALGVLRAGFVLVGNAPSTDGSGTCTGMQDNVGQGALRVLDRRGRLLNVWRDATLLAGPWDLAVVDRGSRATVFVSNVLTGTVTRITLALRDDDRDEGDGRSVVVESLTQIASGYAHRCDSAAFVVGPTGLAFDARNDVLYVASTADNAIFAIADASDTRDKGMGQAVVMDTDHLHGPLGLVRACNGDLISAQGDAVNPDPNQPSELVEFTRAGRFVTEHQVDPASGSAFGVALEQQGGRFRFAAVDDGQNTLDLWLAPAKR